MIDEALNNLEKAKELDADRAEQRKQEVNQRDKALNYEDKANYRADCPDCGHTAHRIQLKGDAREAFFSDDMRCPQCGSDDYSGREV